MSRWYSGIYKACILGSLVAFIIGFFSESKTSLGAYISGYSVLTLGIMMLLIILFKNVLRISSNGSTLEILYSILMTSGPFLLMLSVIGFVLYLLINYKNKIIEGHIAPSYNSFSNIIVMLLLVQVYLVYTNISTDNFETTGKLSKIISSLIYLLGVLTAICSIILSTILKYYSTDGFTNINLIL
jgi:hypothetical protein